MCGALENTYWNLLYEQRAEDIDVITDCISEYITVCTDNCIPISKVRCFSNNKSRVTRDLRALLNENKAFRAGNLTELKHEQKELKQRLKESKVFYQKKKNWGRNCK